MSHQERFVNTNRTDNREALDAARAKLPEYLERALGLDPSKNMLCIFHAEEKPSMALTPDGLHVKCFSCGVVADLVDVIAQAEGLQPRSKEAIDRAIEWAGTGHLINHPRGTSKKPPAKKSDAPKKTTDDNKATDPPQEPPNFHDYIEECASHFDEPDCISYLETRGFGADDFDTLRAFRIGFDVKKRLLIIPHSDFYYTARPIDPVDKADRFKHNPKGAAVEIFNAAALTNISKPTEAYSGENDVVVVCEGAIDALSLIVCGIPAVGLPGVQNCHQQLINDCLIDHPFADIGRCNLGLILAFDNDKGGELALENLKPKLDKVELLYSRIAPPADFNDINDAFKADRTALTTAFNHARAKLLEDVEYHARHVYLSRSARTAPHIVLDDVILNAFVRYDRTGMDADISFLVFNDTALTAAAVASDLEPALYSLYRKFIKKHGVDMSHFNKQVSNFKKKLAAEDSNVVPINPTVVVRHDGPPEFISEGDLPNLPDGSQWNYELEPDWQVDQGGIYRLVDLGRGNFEWRKVSHSAIYISNFIQNIDNGTHKLQLSAYNHGYGWNSSPSLSASELGSTHKIINLGDWGFDVNSNNAKHIIDYLSSFKACNPSNIPRIKTVNRPGWQKDGSFVYPNASDTLQLDGELKDMLAPIFTSAGEKQPIIDLLKEHRDKPVLNLVVGAALAAPLVKILHCQNIAVHFYSNTGSGKSTVNRIAMALYGDPDAEGALPTANATKSGLEHFFDGRHDLPAFVEDIDSVSDERSRRIIQELPYQFVNRTGRLRAKKTGGNDRLIDFRGSLITNGERPLTTATSSGGGKRRLIEYCAPDQIFDKDSARIVSDTLTEHHGLFGATWIKFIQRQGKQIFRNVYNKIRLGSPEVEGLYEMFPAKIPLHIDTISAITIANILFCKMIGDTSRETEQFYLQWAVDMLATLPDEIEIKDSERAKDFIRDWMLSHPRNFTYLIDAKDDPNTRSYETDSDISGYEKFGAWRQKYVAVFPTALRKALSDAGFSPDIILKQLADDGFVIRGDARHLARKVRIDDSLVWMICIDKSKLNVAPENGNSPQSPATDPTDTPSDTAPRSNDPPKPKPPDSYYMPPDEQFPPLDEGYWASLTKDEGGVKVSEPKVSSSAPTKPKVTKTEVKPSTEVKADTDYYRKAAEQYNYSLLKAADAEYNTATLSDLFHEIDILVEPLEKRELPSIERKNAEKNFIAFFKTLDPKIIDQPVFDISDPLTAKRERDRLKRLFATYELFFVEANDAPSPTPQPPTPAPSKVTNSKSPQTPTAPKATTPKVTTPKPAKKKNTKQPRHFGEEVKRPYFVDDGSEDPKKPRKQKDDGGMPLPYADYYSDDDDSERMPEPTD